MDTIIVNLTLKNYGLLNYYIFKPYVRVIFLFQLTMEEDDMVKRGSLEETLMEFKNSNQELVYCFSLLNWIHTQVFR